MTKKSLTLRAIRTGGLNDSWCFLGVAGPDSISFIREGKANRCSGYITDQHNILKFVRTDGKISTTLGTIIIALELGGELPIKDGTTAESITVEFHIISEQDMTCDAILGLNVMADLTRKFGQEATSHDNSWLPGQLGPVRINRTIDERNPKVVLETCNRCKCREQKHSWLKDKWANLKASKHTPCEICQNY